MSFFKRLLGISDSNRGEIFTKVSDQTWVSTKGEVINQVSEDVSESPRVSRRLHTLRRWSHEQEIKPFFP